MTTNTKVPECGIACCKPRWLRCLASIKWFTGWYSFLGILVLSLSSYIVSQITTIEKQFGLSSSQTGYLIACNEIGYSVMILFASHFARRVHIPRVLCGSAIFYGVSGILCSIPHFIYNYDPPSTTGLPKSNLSSMFNIESKLCSNNTIPQPTSLNSSSDVLTSIKQGTQTIEQVRSVAMAFIGIGMILQGFGKAPRYPLLATYLDDNTSPVDTGFYLGIIMSVTIFGPALAYGLGGVFSQMYVTLEEVDLHPRDPRWLGAWWVGFLMFGICAIVFGLPLMCFPKHLVPTSTQRSLKIERQIKFPCKLILKEIKDFVKSILRVLSVPSYTITLLGCIANMLGFTSTLSFGPKYMEKQFNIPAWEANIILAIVGIFSVCIGTFSGGWLTKKIKLNPPRTLMIILASAFVSFIISFISMFLACDPPVIINWQNDNNRSGVIPTPSQPLCISECGCASDQFLPICGADGQNYFSPCHAGCSDGKIQTFSNCTCIPTGTAVSGLCPSDCPAFWPWNILSFVGGTIGSLMLIPFFIFFLRIVTDDIKSMAAGIMSLSMSLFGWLPGPVIGGRLVDAACILWNQHGACSHYDIDQLRYNLYGINISCQGLAIVILLLGLWACWSMHKWPADQYKDSEYFTKKTVNKPESELLMRGQRNQSRI